MLIFRVNKRKAVHCIEATEVTFQADMEAMTSVNSTWPQFEVNFITSVDPEFAILQTVFCIVMLPVSLILMFGIVHYEHFGVDSMKRSFFNQALSALFTVFALNEVLIFTAITIRSWTGPLGHVIGILVSIGRRFFLILANFLSIEILLYKNLCILKPNYISRFRDDFWATFCIGWNVLVGILVTNGEWYLSDHHPSIYLFISGEEDMTKVPSTGSKL